jgi:hypothetical protein
VGAPPLPRPTVGAESSKPARHPIGTPKGLSPSSAALAIGAWLAERGLYPPQDRPWRIEITLDDVARTPMRVFAESIDTRFQVTIRPDEWSYYVAHRGRVSSVRVTDLPRVHLRDDHNFVAATPPLRRIGTLIREFEQRCHVFLQRHRAIIDTSIPGSEPIIRAWVASL